MEHMIALRSTLMKRLVLLFKRIKTSKFGRREVCFVGYIAKIFITFPLLRMRNISQKI